MKKLFAGVLGFFAVCAGLVFWKASSKNDASFQVSLVSPEVVTVNETASCSGYLRAAETQTVKIGTAAEITAVYVSKGDIVAEGEVLFEYRTLSDAEKQTVLYEAFGGEICRSAQESFSEIPAGDILGAAEYYAANGRIPDWFGNFYLGADLSGISGSEAGEKNAVTAAVGGTVSFLGVEAGEYTSGLLPAVTVTNTEKLIAEVGIPQQYLSRVVCGQYANVNCSAYGNSMFGAYVTYVAGEARTTGGLLSAPETVVDAVLAFDRHDDRLIPGLEIRADIFINVWKDAVVVPYSAVCCCDDGGEYVWVWNNGTAEKKQIDPVYEYAKGAVTCGELSAGVMLVDNPEDWLRDGMAVSAVNGK